MDETSWHTWLASSLRVYSESTLALSTSKLCDDSAVRNAGNFENRDTGSVIQNARWHACDTVVILIVLCAFWNRWDAFSIDLIVISSTNLASSCWGFSNTALNLDILADSSWWVRLKSSSAWGTLTIWVERKTAVVGVVRWVVAPSFSEFIV